MLARFKVFIQKIYIDILSHTKKIKHDVQYNVCLNECLSERDGRACMFSHFFCLQGGSYKLKK